MTAVTPASSPPSIDWAALRRQAVRYARRHVPPQDVEDVADAAITDLISKASNIAKGQKWFRAALPHRVADAAGAVRFGRYGLTAVQIRAAYLAARETSHEDAVTAITSYFRRLGYARDTAEKQARTITYAVRRGPAEIPTDPDIIDRYDRDATP